MLNALPGTEEFNVEMVDCARGLLLKWGHPVERNRRRKEGSSKSGLEDISCDRVNDIENRERVLLFNWKKQPAGHGVHMKYTPAAMLRHMH